MDVSAQQQSMLREAMNIALIPLRKATSKPAQRAYLGTFLLAVAALFLLTIASVAYVAFYYSYIPQIGLSRAIHLQFGNGYPHGVAQLSSSLVSQQLYDISLSLHLPRTPANLATGNFMIDMTLLAPTQPDISTVDRIQSTLVPLNGSEAILARSRRPTIMTYSSQVVEMAHVLANLPWMVFGWKQESEQVDISMFEGVAFSKGLKNVPDQVQIVIEAGEKMQFYAATVNIRARFQGLRWIMYNHRILSFLFFTSTFFTVSMISASVAYLLFTLYITPSNTDAPEEKEDIKRKDVEEPGRLDPLSTDDLSDTARTFPTIGRGSLPLQFLKQRSEDAQVKEEYIESTTGIQPLVAEADDEEDFEDDDMSWRDSGIGTGREDRKARAIQRRRRSSQDA